MQQDLQPKTEVKNTILIYADGSRISHRYTTEAEARSYLEQAAQRCEAPSMFAFNTELPAELILSTSQHMLNRVQEAKDNLRAHMILKNALDKNGVPLDRALRGLIHKAVSDMREGAV